MIRSNKENHVSFNVPPRTPMQKNQNAPVKPLMTNAKTQAPFMTPNNNNRVPLGGKDTNTKFQQQQTGKKQQGLQPPATGGTKRQPSPLKRTPLSGKLQSKSINVFGDANTGPAPESAGNETLPYGDWDVESIPERPQPLRDLPLDHVEMDYGSLGVTSRKNLVTAKPERDCELDMPIDALLDREYTWRPSQKNAETPLRSNHSQDKNVKRRDFMAPTKSQQAKQRHITPKFQVARDLPPQIDVDVGFDEIESTLF